jgi:hypothetical protein
MNYPTFKSSAAAIAENGYSVLPLKPGQKRPIPSGWQDYQYKPDDENTFPAKAGIGLLTKNQPASDNDCKVPAIADEINKIVEEEFGPGPVRVGQAPKTLRIFSLDGEPFTKIQTEVYWLDGDPQVGSAGYTGHKFEFLGNGQQAVAFGIHPDTKQPYLWNVQGDPLTVPVGLLPTVSAQQAMALKDKVEKILKGYGRPFGSKGHPEAPQSPTAQEYIMGGGRNEYLSNEAYRLRKQGSTVPQILEVLRALNSARCRPCLSDAELLVIAEGKQKILPDGATTEDFRAYLPQHLYLFAPTGQLWPAASVNSQIAYQQGRNGKPIKASTWLDQNKAVQQMTWAPGKPAVVENRLIANGGWIERAGCATFNLYRPPNVAKGNASKAGAWLDHVHFVYPEHGEHLVKWLAHRVQRPGEKINHGIVMSGLPGVGKDTILEPVKYAIGAWNFTEVSPAHMTGAFNGFVKAVILRISEAHDLGDQDRYAFYDHMKVYLAAPPDVLRCNEKNLREHDVFNVCGVILTSNYKTDGIYLPADDRRHYVTWSPRGLLDFKEGYFPTLYKWFEDGGNGHVAAYLHEVDLSKFDAKQPPPKTPEFWDIVDANRSPEDAELADLIEALNKPNAITLQMLVDSAAKNSSPTRSGIGDWLIDRKNRRQIPHRLEAVGYVPVRNEYADDGLWKIAGRRQAVYAHGALSVRERIAAATELTSQGVKK